METMVATALIVIIFMIASLVLNNLFSNSVKSNTQHITERLLQMEYQCSTNQLSLPYLHTDEKLETQAYLEEIQGIVYVSIEVIDLKSKKKTKSYIIHEAQR